MQERPKLNRMIVVKAKRKERGMGADLIGNERQNHSGKVGIVYETDVNGRRGKELARIEGTTWKDLSRNLHKTAFVPQYVAINKHGETRF